MCLAERPASVALPALRDIVERIRSWQPGSEPLLERVHSAFDAPRGDMPHVGRTHDCLGEVFETIPVEWRPERHTLAGVAPTDRVRRHFLAAHAFANWTAHLGQGLRTWLLSIETANALLDAGLGVREADLLLRHLAEPTELAKLWSTVEA